MSLLGPDQVGETYKLIPLSDSNVKYVVIIIISVNMIICKV